MAAGQCTEVPLSRPEAACLLGCGVMAGIGAAMHTGNVRPGDSVAVFGCGGVGAGAIAGARLAGATTIVAVDVDDRSLTAAGPSAPPMSSTVPGRIPWRRSAPSPTRFGVDVAVEAVGRPEVLEQAFYARDLAGTVVQVGVPTPEMTWPALPMIEFFGRGGALKPSWYGDCLPSRDFPMLINLYRQGRLDLDRFVSETVGIGDVEDAFARMGRGEVLRSVVVLDRRYRK